MGNATITVASQAGACYGVERALDLVEQAARTSQGPVMTLGPLIHNPQVVSDLALKGVGVADEVPASSDVTLVIRSHGVTPDVLALAAERGLSVVDATCPFVKKAQAAAATLAEQGYQVVVVGEAGHPEVEGILANAPGSVAVSDAAQARALGLKGRIGVVVQTTQQLSCLQEVTSELVGTATDLRIANTICLATSERQQAAATLAGEVDVMIVIGGRNSANTGRLAQICSEGCERTHHIESSDELEGSWFDGASHIGVTAGASTPEAQIKLVTDAISRLV